MVLVNILSLKTLSWLLWAFMGLVGVLWACVVWGVSIITRTEKGKANPLRKSKKKLTRELKKSILNLRGVEKFYEKIEKCIFIGIGRFKFEWMWGK